MPSNPAWWRQVGAGRLAPGLLQSFEWDRSARVSMSGARKAAGTGEEIYSNGVGWEMRCHLAQKGLGLQCHYGMRAMWHEHAVWHLNVGFLFKMALCVPVNREFQ